MENQIIKQNSPISENPAWGLSLSRLVTDSFDQTTFNLAIPQPFYPFRFLYSIVKIKEERQLQHPF